MIWPDIYALVIINPQTLGVIDACKVENDTTQPPDTRKSNQQAIYFLSYYNRSIHF